MENNEHNPVPHPLMLDAAGRALSAGEILELERWKSVSIHHQALYDDFRKAEKQLNLLHIYRHADIDQAWSKISSRMPVADEKPIPSRTERAIGFRLMAAAAIMGFFFVMGWLFFNKPVRVQTTARQQKNIILPDGSKVFMNEKTVISYKRNKFSHKRQVDLFQGEAYFEVVHDKSSEFSVRLKDMLVRDIGTSFTLKIDTANVDLIVSSGAARMQVTHDSPPGAIELKKDERAIYDRHSGKITRLSVISPNYKAWQDKNLRYNSTPLAEVITDLNHLYGTKAVFSDKSLEKRRLTAYFMNKTEDQILQIIAKSLRIKIVKKDSIVVISQR